MRITTYLGLLLVSTSSLVAVEKAAAPAVNFSREVLPILSEKCFKCHGPDTKKKGFLRLDSREGATRDLGGYRAIDPGALEKSELLERVFDADDPMPPRDSGKTLSEADRAVLRRWILAGGEYSRHWAFVPPRRPVPPRTHEGFGAIDAFVSAELEKHGASFSPEADRATLARRAALVLTGLPPNPQDLSAFLEDTRADAYERFVDRLLSSPRYGEHQARYWLDAVRYGDTHGLHLDNRRGIFPYRDWVVNAFNDDFPLDDFIVWQLAGDLLPNPTLEQLVATGFVRMNPTTAEGGALPEEFQAKNNFDRVETLGTVLLGMTLICARCHTHKYDPLPQQEYYRLFAFFNSTSEHSMDGNKYDYAPVVKVPENQAAWVEWGSLEHERSALLARAEDAVVSREATLPESAVVGWRSSPPDERLAKLADDGSPLASIGLRDESTRLAARMANARSRFTVSLVARDLDKPRPTRLLRRGEYNLPTGEALEPGVPSVMGRFPESAPRNRLGLARWLTSREHPLVSRVLINRIWQRIFGHGIVRTPEDFGRQGQQPTHPELLDWLAVELQESEWNMKHMLRLMVTSRTFRQSASRRTDVDDPENRLFSRGPSRRLDAEVLRDIGLWASGLLDPQMGGEGVKPYQPGGLWSALAHPASNTKKYVKDKGRRIYRRSIYVYWKRTSPHPMMTLFDAPSRESSCVHRSCTSTPLQSLALLNETQRVEMARAFAERLLHERDDDAARLDLLFTLVASRPADRREHAACETLLSTLRDRYRRSQEDALAFLAIGDEERSGDLDAAEHATWTQVVITVLASDAALLLY